MIVAVSVFEIHIPTGRSLKEKRRVIRPLMEKIHQRYRVSISETDFHDLHQRAQIALAAVHRSRPEMDRMLEKIRHQIEESPGAMLVSWEPFFLEDAP